MKNVLGDGVRLIMKRLNSYGRRADIVGGCVRDFLLDKKPYDFDITTDATPDEMREIFSDMKTLDIGIKHGTLTVIYEDVPYEITTYRVEREYIDHRHPSSVTFSRTLSDDLSRRDFTMNAICYNENDGFTDLYSGIEDIKNKTIRAVKDPYERFDEDALRIMRAIRFAATLGFSIEEKTKAALFDKAHLLAFISKERILAEWRKLISGEYAYEVISEFSDIISKIIGQDAPTRLINREEFNSLTPELREISLFLNEENPTLSYSRYAELLGIEKARRKLGEDLLSCPFDSIPSITEIRVSFAKIGVESTIKKLTLYTAHHKFTLTEEYKSELDRTLTLPYRISDLDINGKDIMALGIYGEAVGLWLGRLLSLVIEGKIENKKETLIAYITENR